MELGYLTEDVTEAVAAETAAQQEENRLRQAKPAVRISLPIRLHLRSDDLKDNE